MSYWLLYYSFQSFKVMSDIKLALRFVIHKIYAIFSRFQLRWLLDNVAHVREAASAGTLMFGTVDSWLIYNLTGGVNGGKHVTDVTNASRYEDDD